MRLAAVYLPKGVLQHLFGKDHEGLTLNLGGLNNYEIIDNNEAIEIKIVSENENFISDFWGSNISNISAIVGRNGIGKTSILRALHSTGDKKKKNVFYLFEEKEESWYYYNELETKTISTDLEIKEINSNALSSVKQYYTPIVDIEQINTLSQLGIVSNGEENLGKLYNKQLIQDVILLNDPVKDTLKTIYPDFPEYTELEIKITQHRKFDFKNVYATANLGSQDRVTVLKTYIESDISDLEEGKWKGLIGNDFIKQNILERYINIINSSGLNSMFDQLWAQGKYGHDLGNDKLHGDSDFMQNFEVTLFTYFVLDATFPQTPFQGTTGNFQSIIDKDSFEEIFDAFFDLYMLSIYGIVRDDIESKLERVSIKDYDKIKEIINEDRHKKWTQQGFKSSDAVELMLRYLDRFKAFFDLYTYLRKSISENQFEIKEDSLIYKLEDHNEKDFYDLIELYNKVLGETNNFVYPLDLLTIRSTYSLSSGEKALLNFFARINNRINKLNSSGQSIFNYYLLLLDEPELGYHPVWKRKFVDAITKSIPVLFAKLNPNRNLLDTESKEFNDLKTQIIFTTHDPLTLSDIPINNVTFIDKNVDTNKSFIVNHNEDVDLATFGANVHDLLAHSFFLENGFMGEYAEGMIKSLINYLTNENSDSENPVMQFEWNKMNALKFINTVDEPFIKERLTNLFDEKYLLNDKQALLDKRDEIDARLNEIEDEED